MDPVNSNIIDELEPFLLEVYKDIVRANDNLGALNDPVNRRAFVRACFFYIEGTLSWYAQVFAESGTFKRPLSEDEIAGLKGVQYEIRQNGQLEPREAKTPLANRVRFVFRCMQKSLGVTTDCSWFYSSAGWSSFQEAIKVRDRVTHPGSLNDLKIDDPNLRRVKAATSWFSLVAKFLLAISVERSRQMFSKLSNETAPMQELVKRYSVACSALEPQLGELATSAGIDKEMVLREFRSAVAIDY